MNTLKTGVVIVLLLGVSYGVYQIVNAPDPSMIGEEEPLVEFDQKGMQEFSPGEANFQNPNAYPSANNYQAESDGFKAPPLDQNPVVRTDPNRSDEKPDSQFRNPYAEIDSNGRGVSPQGMSSGKNIAGAIVDEGTLEEMGRPVPENRLVPLPGNQADSNAFENRGGVLPASHVDQANPLLPFDEQLREIESLANQGRLRTALEQLSPYHHETLDQNQKQMLYQWLDYLAFKVIYSPEHNIYPNPHVVQYGETVFSLAKAWNVPAELIYNINRGQITNPNNLVPGVELKVVKGPFRAEISIAKSELTMFLDNMYAGRFPVTFGNDANLQPSLLRVQSKSNNGAEYRNNGQLLAANDPNNPYGRYWLDIGGRNCIHEKQRSLPAYDQRGCISISSEHAKDVYGILSKNSSVKISE